MSNLHLFDESRLDLSKLQNFNEQLDHMSHFTCPCCGNRFDVQDAVIEDVITESKSAGSTIRGRKVVHKFIDTHYNIRFCPKCARKRKLISKWSSIFCWVICPAVITVLTMIFDTDEGIVLRLFSGLLAGFLISTFLIALPLSLIINNGILHVDIDKARKGNAISSPFL